MKKQATIFGRKSCKRPYTTSLEKNRAKTHLQKKYLQNQLCKNSSAAGQQRLRMQRKISIGRISLTNDLNKNILIIM